MPEDVEGGLDGAETTIVSLEGFVFRCRGNLG